MDLVFVLDLSGSISTVYDVITTFTERVIYGVNMKFGRTQVGVIVFSDDADVIVYLEDYTVSGDVGDMYMFTHRGKLCSLFWIDLCLAYSGWQNVHIIAQDKEAVLNAINFGRTGGKTDTAAAIRRMRDDAFIDSAGDRPGVDNRAVIITDGKSNDESGTLQEASDARDDDIEIFVVALGESPRSSEVNGMASDPDSDHVVNLHDLNGVEGAVNELLDQLCQWIKTTLEMSE